MPPAPAPERDQKGLAGVDAERRPVVPLDLNTLSEQPVIHSAHTGEYDHKDNDRPENAPAHGLTPMAPAPKPAPATPILCAGHSSSSRNFASTL